MWKTRLIEIKLYKIAKKTKRRNIYKQNNKNIILLKKTFYIDYEFNIKPFVLRRYLFKINFKN